MRLTKPLTLSLLVLSLAGSFAGSLVGSLTGCSAPSSNWSSGEEPAVAPEHAEPAVAPGEPAEHAEYDRHHRFDDPQKYVERWNSPERDEWQMPAEVVSLMEIKPGMRVVDLGTGTGYFVPHLAAAVGPKGQVVAADVEQAMVDYVAGESARKGMQNVEARVVPADAPGLAPASADRVLVVNTWHHLDDREAYAAKLAQGLRPGGLVAVVDYTMEAEEGAPKNIRVAPFVVIEELAAGGLDAVLVQETLPRQYVVIARKK